MDGMGRMSMLSSVVEGMEGVCMTQPLANEKIPNKFLSNPSKFGIEI